MDKKKWPHFKDMISMFLTPRGGIGMQEIPNTLRSKKR